MGFRLDLISSEIEALIRGVIGNFDVHAFGFSTPEDKSMTSTGSLTALHLPPELFSGKKVTDDFLDLCCVVINFLLELGDLKKLDALGCSA